MEVNVAVPDYVITLVHGTFAPNSKWTRHGSRLRTILEESLGGPERVRFEAFKWGGDMLPRLNNGFKHRQKASERLARHISALAARFPRSTHVLIGHSHGGNVALYSLRDSQVRSLVRGVVCLATPFLSCRARDVTALSGYGWLLKLVLIPFLVGSVGIVWLALASALSKQLPERWLLFVLSGIPAIGVEIGLLALAVKLEDRIIINLTSLVRRLQRNLLTRIRLPDPRNVQILCVQVLGDVAKTYLRVVTHAVDALSFLWSAWLYVPLFFALDVLLLRNTFILPAPWLDEMIRRAAEANILNEYRFGITHAKCFELLLLLASSHLILILIAARGLRGTSVGLGSELLIQSALIAFTVADWPPLSNLEKLTCSELSGDLRHSAICNDDDLSRRVSASIRTLGDKASRT
jgi:pimeloyl-ACP methyl ester carboxylesterase